ncbi:hypothetical protein [Subtercola boreus]|uniref:Uncharacterized protein n=1 Tax=Subtercola boreus TaxID=120213 RepID=A0A3E0WCD6_9MICO|nr:hypothetical protein [Subtercola boreus]RFA22366.1 hypothetical protein B7R24_04270 [Subtercola boreus]RFA22428.1 hypothetical protein B7R23_04265 [Subtercola boreus]RFA28443.1 hypothetical protein B7R25_04280 [Subtercola boreus]
MSDTNLGTDGTIPNSEDGLAVGHVPDGSHFNPEEEGADTDGSAAGSSLPGTVPAAPASAATEGTGSYTDREGDDREDRPDEASGSYTGVDE